jgi:hypothetical protein
MADLFNFNKHLVENQVKRELNVSMLMHCPHYFGDFIKDVIYNETTGVLTLTVTNKLLMRSDVDKDASVTLKRIIYELDTKTVNSSANQLYKIAYDCILAEMRKKAISIIVTVIQNLETDVLFEHVKTEYQYRCKKNFLPKHMLGFLDVGTTWKLLIAANTTIDKMHKSCEIGAPLLFMAVNLNVEKKEKL